METDILITITNFPGLHALGIATITNHPGTLHTLEVFRALQDTPAFDQQYTTLLQILKEQIGKNPKANNIYIDHKLPLTRLELFLLHDPESLFGRIRAYVWVKEYPVRTFSRTTIFFSRTAWVGKMDSYCQIQLLEESRRPRFRVLTAGTLTTILEALSDVYRMDERDPPEWIESVQVAGLNDAHPGATYFMNRLDPWFLEMKNTFGVNTELIVTLHGYFCRDLNAVNQMALRQS